MEMIDLMPPGLYEVVIAARAIAAIPQLLPAGVGERSAALDAVRRMVTAQGALSGEAAQRFARIETLFAADAGAPSGKARETGNAGA